MKLSSASCRQKAMDIRRGLHALKCVNAEIIKYNLLKIRTLNNLYPNE